MKAKKLPPCMYQKHGAYYLVKAGKWTRLGDELDGALAEYERLMPRKDLSSMERLIDAAMPSLLKGRAKNTQEQYIGCAERIKKILRDVEPDELRPRHVAQIKRHMAGTPNAFNRLLSVLRLVFDYALEEQIVELHPCASIKRLPEKKRTRYLTDTEFAAVRSKGSPRFRAMVDILYLTGQRVSDVLAIRRADLEEAGIAFKQQKTGHKMIVAWSPDLRRAANSALALHGSVPRLTLFFTRSRWGGPPSYGTVRDQWRRASADAGVKDATIHDIRAKSLTDAKRAGLDATALAGHTSEAMTERYIRDRIVPVVPGPTLSKAV